MFMVFAMEGDQILELKTCEFFDEAQNVANQMILQVRGFENDTHNWYEDTNFTDYDSGISIQIANIG